MQADSILEKAKQLGISIDDNASINDNLSTIKASLGLDNDVDLNTIENELNNRVNELDNIEVLDDNINDNFVNNSSAINNQSDSSNNIDVFSNGVISPTNENIAVPPSNRESLGKKAYNEAKNKDGVYDKNYYAKKGQELDEKVKQAENEKNTNWKKKDPKDEEPVKADGSNTKNKNIIDKVKDDANLLKAKNDRFQNKVNRVAAAGYSATHPGEVLKDKAVATAKNTVKEVGHKAGEEAKKVGAAVGKNASKAVEGTGKAIVSFVSKNPHLVLLIGIIIFVIFIIILLFARGVNNSGSGSQSYKSACDAIALNNTSLSKSEFVELVELYYATSNSNTANLFKNNAESIYEIATINNINPELVVVRAAVEGYSPGGETHNYWGLGCYNTSPACFSYSSFDEGVLAYVENISQYESTSDMMSSYAFIGDYWFSSSISNGSSKGGCYYFPYIREYMSNSRANEVEKICSNNNTCTPDNTSGCVATTEEDQEAYSKYQVNNMALQRKTMFGLEPDVCKYNGDCIIYAQADPKWASVKLGRSSSTMGRSGCAVTAIATAISCTGADLSVNNFDAGIFINELNEGNCFTDGGGIYWGCSAMQNILPTLTFVEYVGVANYSNDQKTALINSYNPENHFILLHFVNQYHKRGHFVVYTETSGDYYVTKDPSGGRITNQLISEIDRIVVYSY